MITELASCNSEGSVLEPILPAALNWGALTLHLRKSAYTNNNSRPEDPDSEQPY